MSSGSSAVSPPPLSQPTPTPAEDAAALPLEGRVRLLLDGAFNYLPPLVTACLTLVLVPVMLQQLGRELYGVWIACAAVQALVAAADLGLGSTLTRETAAGAAPDGTLKGHALAFASAALQVYLLVGLAGAAIIALAGLPLSSTLHLTPANREIAAAVCRRVAAGFFFDRILVFSVAVLGGLRRFRLLNAVSIATMLVRGGGFLLLLLWAHAGIVALATWQAAVAAASALMALVLIQRPLSGVRWWRRTDWRVLTGRAEFALVSQLITITAAAVWQAPVLIIAAFLGAPFTVPFHIGLRFPLFVVGLNGRLATVFFSESMYVRAENRALLAATLEFGTRLLLVTTLPVAVVLWVVAPALLQAWLGAVDPTILWILRLGLVTLLADACANSAFQLLWGLGSVRALLIVTIATLVATAVLAGVLLPTLGTRGAALALAIAITGGAGALTVIGARRCGTRPARLFASVPGLLIPAAACGMAAAATVRWLPGRPWMQVSVSAGLGSVAFFLVLLTARPDQPEMAVVRSLARQIRPLRSLWYLLHELGAKLRPTPWTAASFDRIYASQADAWRYDSAWGHEYLGTTARLISLAAKSSPCHRACDVGCGDGRIAALLAQHCDSVLGVDVSEAGLERARHRCRDFRNVRFLTWDVTKSAAMGHFDLILAAGVLEILPRPALSDVRDQLVGMLKPGGHLLVALCRQNEVTENAWWDRWLLRGSAHLRDFLAQHSKLELTHSEATSTHLFCLLRHRAF